MITLLKNEFERIRHKKEILVIALVIMPLLIAAAIFFSGHTASKEVIAFQWQDQVPDLQAPDLQAQQYVIKMVKEAPALSQLILGEYIAYVTKAADGSYTVMSLKSNEDKAAIKALFQTGHFPPGYKSDDQKRQERGVGTNILGFITMMMLMQGVALTALYPEDRVNKTFRRIMTSPVSVRKYLSAQLIFTMVCLYFPTFAAILAIHFVCGTYIGYPLGVIALLLLILTLFSTAFALFISSALDRNASLVTSGVSIVTCILAGCFVPIVTNNSVLSQILKLIPQSSYMTLVHGIEFGDRLGEYTGAAVYILLWTLLLWLAGIAVTQMKAGKPG